MLNDLPIRKIIHVDMDAFHASVEQLDNPDLRGKPLAVGGSGRRGVVGAASYEARKFGVKSAMTGRLAIKLCPDLIFVSPRFERYAEISKRIHKIFHEYTDLVEPLSMDEAYLDVTQNKKGNPSATLMAKEIRQRIFDELNLTASAGISINKYIAKIAIYDIIFLHSKLIFEARVHVGLYLFLFIERSCEGYRLKSHASC